MSTLDLTAAIEHVATAIYDVLIPALWGWAIALLRDYVRRKQS